MTEKDKENFERVFKEVKKNEPLITAEEYLDLCKSGPFSVSKMAMIDNMLNPPIPDDEEGES